MPFFVENQSGTKIYAIDGVLGFEIKHTPPLRPPVSRIFIRFMPICRTVYGCLHVIRAVWRHGGSSTVS